MLDSLCYMLLHVLWRLYVVVNVRGLFLVLSRVLLLSVVLVVHTCLESRYFEFGQSSVCLHVCFEYDNKYECAHRILDFSLRT